MYNVHSTYTKQIVPLHCRPIKIVFKRIKPNLSLYWLYYAKACNELAAYLRIIAPGQRFFQKE